MIVLILLTFFDAVCAKVGGSVITLSEVVAISRVFTNGDTKSALNLAIDLYTALESGEVHVSDFEVDEYIKGIWGEGFKISGLNKEEFRELVKARIILDKVAARLLGVPLNITENELRRFYSENLDLFMKKERRLISYVIVLEGLTLPEHPQALTSFAEEHNLEVVEDVWVEKGELPPELDLAVFSCAEGEVTVAEKGGKRTVILVKKVERGGYWRFEEVENEVRNLYIQRKYEEVLSRWLTEEKKRLNVEVIRDP